jgi:hypothetical protein
MGIPGQFNDPRVAEAYKKVIAACRKHGKFPGMGGMYTPELLERHIAMGVQLILSGSDFSLLMQAGKARAELVRGFEKRYFGVRATIRKSRARGLGGFPYDQSDVQPGTGRDVHERVQAEKTNAALQQSVQARLRQPEGLGGLRLRHAAGPVEILDAHHQLRAQPEVLGFRLAESQIQKDVAAALGHFQLAHQPLLSFMSAASLRRASSISSHGVRCAFF